MAEKDNTQNILDMMEKASLAKAATDEFAFRLQVLTGIAEVRKEFSLFRESTTNQIEDLYGKTNILAVSGCSKASMHADQEIRLREVEKEVAVLAVPPPKGTVVNGNGKKSFVFGKWFRFEGFSATDIIVILTVILLGYVISTKHLDAQRVSDLETQVNKLKETSMKNGSTSVLRNP